MNGVVGMRRRAIMAPNTGHGIGRLAVAVACACGTMVAQAQSLDRVRLVDRTEVVGEIITVGPGEVAIKDQRDGEARILPIERIVAVSLAGEPEALRNARNLLLRQDAAAALEELAKIEQVELDGASDLVLADVEFVNAAAAAAQATATGTDLEAGERGLRDFLAKHGRSHHAFRAHELLGDLLVRAGKFPEAASAYTELAKGPPAFKVRAATAKASSFYAQKMYAEAEKEYAAVAAAEIDPQDAAGARQRREAAAGRARCLTRLGKADEAVAALQDMIRETDEGDRELLARAFAALGDAYGAAGKGQDAIIAFLTVDLVYNTVPESHAEALYNLVQLWERAKNPERSREARQALETTYPDSRWTKSLAAPAGTG